MRAHDLNCPHGTSIVDAAKAAVSSALEAERGGRYVVIALSTKCNCGIALFRDVADALEAAKALREAIAHIESENLPPGQLPS